MSNQSVYEDPCSINLESRTEADCLLCKNIIPINRTIGKFGKTLL